jgi:TRAP-type C4-dicarboxylate transport system permease small subunit
MKPLLKFLHRRAEDVLVLLAAAMFFAFLAQIGTRYLLNDPHAWPHEVIVITWLWLIFWGSAFFLKDRDHVKFDVLYRAGPAAVRRALSIVVALTLVGFFLLSAPKTWDFISFKNIRGTDHFRIPLGYVFSVYLLFLAGVVVHYGWRAWRLIRGDSVDAVDGTESS